MRMRMMIARVMVEAGIWLIDHAEWLAPLPPIPESLSEPVIVRCPRCGAGGPALAWIVRADGDTFIPSRAHD